MTQLAHQLRPNSSAAPRLLVLAAVCLAGAMFCVWQTWQRHQALQTVRAETAMAKAKQAAANAAKPTRAEIDELRRWEAMKQERNFPWQKVFAAVGRANSKEIELLEFQPDKRALTIMLRGEARNKDALADYVDALAEQPAFGKVHLIRQQPSKHDRLETVAFEIKALLRD